MDRECRLIFANQEPDELTIHIRIFLINVCLYGLPIRRSPPAKLEKRAKIFRGHLGSPPDPIPERREIIAPEIEVGETPPRCVSTVHIECLQKETLCRLNLAVCFVAKPQVYCG